MGTLRAVLVLLALSAGALAAGEEAIFIDNISITAGDPARPRTIERGAILIEDGIIRRVGSVADVQAPPGARRIDGAGRHAVPAFIDALTAAGLPERAPASRNEDRPPDFRAGPTPESREALRAGITPERDVLDEVEIGGAAFDRWRRSGFAAANIAPSPGTIAGRSALLGLAGLPLRESVIGERTGIAGSFSSPDPGYPGSLMGTIAHLRQTFLDARHNCGVWEFQRQESLGARRPARDTALESIQRDLLSRQLPFIFAAEDRNAIHRALRLGGEFQLRLAIAGGREAARALSEIRAAGVPVILLADYPEKPKTVSEPGALPPRVQEDRIARWREMVGTAAALREAGIAIAFGSGGKKDPEALLKSVRAAIEEGFSAPEALRALTLGAAELLGADRTAGSIAEGKIASIAILDRPFPDPKAKVTHLVADGVLFEYEQGKKPDAKPEEAKEKPAAEEKKPAEEKPEKKEIAPAPGQVVDCELESDRKPRLRTGGDLLIRDATVWTLARGVLPRASIRIRGGKIEAVGPDLAPEGIASVIDASGWHVIPGIIDCHSHLAISGGVNESSESITCQVRIADVIDPTDPGIYRALAGGVTAAHLLHGSANAIGGQCALVKLKYGRSAEDMFAGWAPPTVKFALGENPKRSNFSSVRGERFPATRMGVEAVYRRAFTAARQYAREWEEHAARRARGERSLEPRRDLRLEALNRILGGEIRVHCHSYRADELLMMCRVAEEFGFHIATFQHVLEGYKVAPEIARHGAGGSTFSDWWAYKIEAWDAIPYNGALMTRAGITVSFNSDSDELIRHLHYEAAKGMRYGGLSEEQALALVTLNPARQLRIDGRTGTIEPGKDADLAIFDAHPLSVYTRCRFTIIEGEVYFEKGGERLNPNAGRPLAPAEDFLPAPPPRSPSGEYAIRGARVVPVDAIAIDRGSVVIARGRIAAVGPEGSVAIPAGAAVIDGEGLEVYPGFIDAGSHLGLTEIDSVRGSVDLGETGSAQPDLRMATAVNAHSELIPVARAGGITAAAVFNRGGLLAGRAAAIRLAGSSTPETIVRDEIGLQVSVPFVRREQKDEPAEAKELKEWFARARRYAEARAAGSASLEPDPRLDALIPYLRRELPVIFSADTEMQIRLAVKLAGDLEVVAVVRGGRDAWKVAPLLKEKGIPVIVGPVLALPGEEFDPYDAPYGNAGRLFQAGVPLAFQSGDAADSRNLPYQAGAAAAWGLPRDAAIRALTLGGAEILGLAAERGSITPGKVADLVVTDGDPLEIRTRVRYVFISGKPVSLENRHTRLYREFHDRLQVPAAAPRTDRF